jgi:CO/xanthine dehydrogenase FAD-binding subunit
MKPAPFEYMAPNSLGEALGLMQEHGFDAKILAGGQSLLPMMNFRLAQPSLLVDINGVAEMNRIQRDGGGDLRLGAMVRHHEMEHDPQVAQASPLLHEAMPHIAHPQIRNRGTLGGSLAHADPAAELPAVMVALDASFRLERAGSERSVSAEEFFLGLFTTDCEPEEILVEVSLPAMPARTGYAFEEMARRHGDYALVGVAALVTLDESQTCTAARLVYLSVGEVPMIARQAASMLIGEKPTEQLFTAAADVAVRQEIAPAGDIHASVEFKRHLARVLTVRALKRATARAQA